MPVKINELVIQVKVYETNKQVDHTKSMPAGFLLHTTEQQKLALERDVLNLLEDRATR
ncbi:hypothetical protein ACRRVA_02565 [Candidatus Cardinium hertigii]|uniref:hypothetical protein n=1 Tax=Candidatus Cardinium TaxID=273135 RepID=UPI00027EA3A4|nr:hypothetical protein [Cardinium endosymbiont of Encarsia pergandiella]CCM10239.1 Afp-like protein [Cardinium endosymbiont cEper1 of Encarsia pergandiella]